MKLPNMANTKANGCTRPSDKKPYCSIGAGSLSSFLWKRGDQVAGFRYRFNLFRLHARTGQVSQTLRPSDLHDLAKLIQVLAAVTADDGCLPDAQRRELYRLAGSLDEMLRSDAE